MVALHMAQSDTFSESSGRHGRCSRSCGGTHSILFCFFSSCFCRCLGRFFLFFLGIAQGFFSEFLCVLTTLLCQICNESEKKRLYCTSHKIVVLALFLPLNNVNLQDQVLSFHECILRMYCIDNEALVFMFNGGSSYDFTIPLIFTGICMLYLHY